MTAMKSLNIKEKHTHLEGGEAQSAINQSSDSAMMSAQSDAAPKAAAESSGSTPLIVDLTSQSRLNPPAAVETSDVSSLNERRMRKNSDDMK